MNNEKDDDEADSGTIKNSLNDRTLVPQDLNDGTLIGSRTGDGTMIEHDTATLVPHGRDGRAMPDEDDMAENLGTMVINSDGEEDEDSTMKREQIVACGFFQRLELHCPHSYNPSGHETADGQSSKIKYRPLFLDHFEKKDAAEKQGLENGTSTVAQPIAMTPEEQKRFESNLQRQLNQISAGQCGNGSIKTGSD